jgi:hypothetical protein
MAKLKSAETPSKSKNKARPAKRPAKKPKAIASTEDVKRHRRPRATANGDEISTHIQADLQKLEHDLAKLIEYIALGGSVFKLPPQMLQSAKMNIQTLIDMTTVAESGGITKVKDVLSGARLGDGDGSSAGRHR